MLKRRVPTSLIIGPLIVVLVGVLALGVRRAVHVTNEDAWARSVVTVVAYSAIQYTDALGHAPDSIADLVSRGFLIVQKEPGFIKISSPPPMDAGSPRLASLGEIRLHFPSSIEGWNVVDGVLRDNRGAEATLPYVEIIGVEYSPSGMARAQNQAFAREWFKVMQRKRAGARERVPNVGHPPD